MNTHKNLDQKFNKLNTAIFFKKIMTKWVMKK